MNDHVSVMHVNSHPIKCIDVCVRLLDRACDVYNTHAYACIRSSYS